MQGAVGLLVLLLTPLALRAQVDDWPRRLGHYAQSRAAAAAGRPALAQRFYDRASALPRGTPERQRRFVERVNYHRRQAMLPPVMPHPGVAAAAASHAAYLSRHTTATSLSLSEAHQEVPGRVGFTGVDATARVRAQGLPGVAGEGVAWAVEPEEAVDSQWNNVYHRATMADPWVRYVGFASQGQAVMNQYRHWSLEQDDNGRAGWMHYPGADQEGVPPEFRGETPTPLPGHEPPFGPPLSVGNGAGAPELLELELTGPRGAVPVVAVAPRPRVGPEFLGVWAFRVPARPLAPRTRYQVRARARRGSETRSLRWSFTTGARVPLERWVRPGVMTCEPRLPRVGERVRCQVPVAASNPEDGLATRWTLEGAPPVAGPDLSYEFTRTPAHQQLWVDVWNPRRPAARGRQGMTFPAFRKH